MAKSYIMDHIRLSLTDEEGMEFMVEPYHEYDDLVRAPFPSSHSKNKNHATTIQFGCQKQQPIEAWYCTCSAGALEVGMYQRCPWRRCRHRHRDAPAVAVAVRQR